MRGSTGQIDDKPVLTAADARVRAAQVRAFRARMWGALLAPPVLPAPAAPPLQALTNQDIDVLRARLLALTPPVSPGQITVRRVLEVTARHFGTTVPDLLSRCRKQPLRRRRQIAMFVAHKMTGRSLPFIGQYMDGRDHSTILQGKRVVQSLISSGDAGIIVATAQIVDELTEESAPMNDSGGESWTS